MLYVYSLSHEHYTSDETADIKQIGYFSSRKESCQVIEEYKKLDGFREYPNNFVIKALPIVYGKRVYSNIEYPKVVYVLNHSYEDEEGFDVISWLGIYASYDLALRSQQKYMRDKKFNGYPDCFIIDEYEVNKPEWSEGFFTWKS